MAKQILLAESSTTMQRVVQMTFAAEDFEITTASSVSDALASAKSVAPDLVIVDAALPPGDGYELCASLKTQGIKAPILLMHGTSHSFDLARSRRVGADGDLQKPFESQRIIDLANEMMAGGVTAIESSALASLSSPIGTNIGAAADDILSSSAATPTTAAPAPMTDSAAASDAPSPKIPRPSGLPGPDIRAPLIPTPQASSPAPQASSPAPRAPQAGSRRVGSGLPPFSDPAKSAPTTSSTPGARSPRFPRSDSAPALPAAVPDHLLGKKHDSKPSPLIPAQREASPFVRPTAGTRPVGHDSAIVIEAEPPPSSTATSAPFSIGGVPSPARTPEQGRTITGRTSAEGITPEAHAAIVQLSREVIEQVVWDVVPDLAETIIREQLDRLVAGRSG